MMVIIKINKQIKITNFSFFSAGSEIYDDAEDFEEISSSPSSTTSFSQSKLTANITSHLPAHAEEAQKHDYEEESDSYQNDINDDETTNQDDSQVFGDTMSVNRPDLKKKVPMYRQHLEYLLYHQIFGVIFFLNLEFLLVSLLSFEKQNVFSNL
jgi:hypothetical protein